MALAFCSKAEKRTGTAKAEKKELVPKFLFPKKRNGVPAFLAEKRNAFLRSERL